jgi:hypothetical protein
MISIVFGFINIAKEKKLYKEKLLEFEAGKWELLRTINAYNKLIDGQISDLKHKLYNVPDGAPEYYCNLYTLDKLIDYFYRGRAYDMRDACIQYDNDTEAQRHYKEMERYAAREADSAKQTADEARRAADAVVSDAMGNDQLRKYISKKLDE